MPIELDPLAGPKGADEGIRLAKFWKDQIDTVADSTEYRRWTKRGEAIEKRYRDERARVNEESQRHYNALWANVEILFPALYGKVPVPIAERKFRDRDPVARGAAQILERGLRNEIEINGFDEAMQGAVKDYLLPGRGVVWVRYEPLIEQSVSLPPDTETDMKDSQGSISAPRKRERLRLNESINEPTESDQKLHDTSDRVVRESIPIDYVAWTDFLSFPVRARTWKEVTAVGKRVYMSRKQMIKRFGKRIGKAIPLERDDRGIRGYQNNQPGSDADKGQVYEIWSRDDETVYWVARGYDFLLDRKDDPLKLENFFPCPRPIYSNATNNTLVPVPDYIQYQDQATQIDELTQRIAMLSKACKMAGLYNAAAKDIQRLFDETVENQLIPVDDWAAFAEKGGVEGNISLLPLKEIIGILNELMVIKEKQVLEMDRLTGITDIMRGTTDARETLGGQRLKTNSAGTRLQRRQNEVARLARDVIRMMADIMAQHFSPQSLVEVSGALFEEGLGSPDMPDLTALQSPSPAPSSQPKPQLGGSPLPPMAPPAGMQPPPPPMGGATAGGPPQIPGGAPPIGQNVIPFKPNLPPAPVGMPPQAPQMPMGAPEPQIPPEVAAKIEGIKRIAAAIQLLRNEKLRGFRVDIEVDSTIYGDMMQEREDRTQFIAEITGYLEKSMMMVAQVPEMAPMLGKLLLFGVRGHRVGRDLEATIEDFCDQVPAIAKKKQAEAAQNKNPEQLKAEADMLSAQSKAEAAKISTENVRIKATSDIQAIQLKAQSDREAHAADIERQRIENEGEVANSQADVMIKQMDVQMRQMEYQIEQLRAAVDMMKAKNDMKLAQHEADQQDQEHELAQDQMGLEKKKLKHEATQTDKEHELAEVQMKHEKEKAKLDIQKAKEVAKKPVASGSK